MTEIEIRKVANGFLAIPAWDGRDKREMHVFSDWASCSKWVGDEFRKELEPKSAQADSIHAAQQLVNQQVDRFGNPYIGIGG